MYKSQILDSFAQLVAQEDSLLIERLWDAPKAVLLKLLQEQLQKPILVITSEFSELKICDDADYFDLHHILEFPSWETLPGEEIAPSPDIIGKRLEILHMLLSTPKAPLVLAPLQAVLQRLPSLQKLKKLLHLWKKGDLLEFSSIEPLLKSLGYRRVPVVADKGEFAVRGGIIDLFPLSATDPYRLDFFADTLESIRIFDPISQKTTGHAEKIFLCPADELSLLRDDKKPSLLLDYLGDDYILIFDDLLALEDRYTKLYQKLPANRLFASLDEILKRSQRQKTIFWTKEAVEELSHVAIAKRVGRGFYSGKIPVQPLTFEMFHHTFETKRWQHPFVALEEILEEIEHNKKTEKHFICATETEEKVLREKIGEPAGSIFERGYLSSGFALVDSTAALIPMTVFTGRTKIRRSKWRSAHHTPAAEFHELAVGDLVVHFHNGIGKYLGMEKQKNHAGVEAEFLVLEYAEKSKLFVPISQAYLVSRYIGAHEVVPTLHTLGTKSWQKTKLHAQKAIIGYAQDLLRLSAEREVKGGFAFPPDSPEMITFEAEFPYTETEDQLQAIAALKKDMSDPRAMDRLICGDVGYGKTEVAMRAAFKAAVDGKKQVAVLVPTTVLALQHYETFSARMAGHPVTIRAISRFHSAKEVKETIKLAKEGKVDILIGTHRLISKDIVFKNLGLVIIDEEQRFGVRAKEHLKALTIGVDCLTLTATPIPRTLYLSLVGARHISVISTPPQDRLPIKTIIAEKDLPLVQNALLRELSRDGQAYFIHNRVESIFLVSEEIQKLLPEAKIVVGHGQLSPDEIDTVFHQFKNGDADILIATTIIENGIDIPNANTIIIDNADHFGLADLYQLRGRVGRWNRPAYAYFLYNKKKELSELSRKRLFALAETQGYGGGMKIAMRDLEIRGAGDILGTQQSGQVSAVGFHLYCKLLKKTINSLKNKSEPTFFETKLEFSFDAKLPEDYITETSLRLEIYHRLGEALKIEDIDLILAELKDRFGPYPTPVLWLTELTKLRILASGHRYTLVKFSNHTLYTEQLKGKETVKKSIPLTKINKPHDLESVRELLT